MSADRNDDWPSMDDTLHDFGRVRPMPDPHDTPAMLTYLVERQDYSDRVIRKILLLIVIGKLGGKAGHRIMVAVGGLITFALAAYGAFRGLK